MSPKHFLYCWSLDTADRLQEEGVILGHIAGQQLKRVQAGDTVWIISYLQGEISLRGRIVAGKVTDFQGAVERMGTSDLWESDYHIIAVPETEEPLDDIPLKDWVAEIRFNSKVDRLTLDEDGSVDPHQLQVMRELTEDSATLLEEVWGNSAEVEIPLEQLDEWSRAAGFGDPGTNRCVEIAAVEFVRQWYAERGWQVRSVETKKLGYDLHCHMDGSEECVEVKGVSGPEPRFIITEGEVVAAESNPTFFLCVVTSALSSQPQLHRFSGEDFLEGYDLFALQHLAVPSKGLQA